MQDILLGVNLQLDFFPGGALDFKGNQDLIQVANQLARRFEQSVLVYDWHPADHVSFAGNHLWRYPGQVLERPEGPLQLWLIHSVAESFGAELHPKIEKDLWQMEFIKGMDPLRDTFSCLSAKAKTGDLLLSEFLAKQDIKRIYLFGMCTEFDILETALCARELGLEVVVIHDACYAAGFQEKADTDAFARMEAAGVLLESSAYLSGGQ
ncbi:MAG: isochorismatase family protein [Saprospiraceae bacterium]|nr:isochorismatase family protein [Saprospiraceae bacterium]